MKLLQDIVLLVCNVATVATQGHYMKIKRELDVEVRGWRGRGSLTRLSYVGISTKIRNTIPERADTHPTSVSDL